MKNIYFFLIQNCINTHLYLEKDFDNLKLIYTDLSNCRTKRALVS